MEIFRHFPGPEELADLEFPAGQPAFEVNAHIHTPFSFSAFSDVKSIFSMAVLERIDILGINDFYVTDGYTEFYENALVNKIFPLFNIEFISLDRDMQQKGIRVNDPNNPGRIYFSGKGLDFPQKPDESSARIVNSVKAAGMNQVRAMVEKTNELLAGIGSEIRLDFDRIHQDFAKELVRERHIAKALRIRIFEQYQTPDERKSFLTVLYGGKEPKANLSSDAETEIEIRNNLLKAGGKAFVEEDESAFLKVEEVIGLIIKAGGIPCYPVLLDDAKGNYTDFEGNKEQLYTELTNRNIFCMELIPGRNSYPVLKEFVNYFHEKGFILMFGTEHNTPEMVPLAISCRCGEKLDRELKKINSDGASLIAAHQYYRTREGSSPVHRWNELKQKEKSELINLGNSVVQYFIHTLL